MQLHHGGPWWVIWTHWFLDLGEVPWKGWGTLEQQRVGVGGANTCQLWSVWPLCFSRSWALCSRTEPFALSTPGLLFRLGTLACCMDSGLGSTLWFWWHNNPWWGLPCPSLRFSAPTPVSVPREESDYSFLCVCHFFLICNLSSHLVSFRFTTTEPFPGLWGIWRQKYDRVDVETYFFPFRVFFLVRYGWFTILYKFQLHNIVIHQF